MSSSTTTTTTKTTKSSSQKHASEKEIRIASSPPLHNNNKKVMSSGRTGWVDEEATTKGRNGHAIPRNSNDGMDEEENKLLAAHGNLQMMVGWGEDNGDDDSMDDEEQPDDETPTNQRVISSSSSTSQPQQQQRRRRRTSTRWTKTQCTTLACLVLVAASCFLFGLFVGVAQRVTYTQSPSSSSQQQEELPPPPQQDQAPQPTMPITSTPTIPPPPPPTTTIPPPWPPSDLTRLATIKQHASSLITSISTYYGKYAEKVLYGTNAWIFGFNSEDASPLAPTDSFQRTVQVIARSLLYGEPLKLGFLGSSVMCGHDNCYKYSFPSQLKVMLDPIWKSQGGIQLRNACQGGSCGDTFANQIFCYEHMVGNDVDFIFYEWTYFEGNENVALWHELIARWALLLPKSPPLIIFNAINQPWGGGNAENEQTLMAAYGKYGANGFCMDCGLKSTGLWQGFSDDAWGKLGDGMHSAPRMKGANGKVFVNWHPGPLGFQYAADITSFMLARATLEAAKILLNIPSRAEAEAMYNKITGFVPHLRGIPPVLIKGGGDNALSEDNPLFMKLALLTTPPACITMQLSTFGKSNVVVADNPTDTNNPYASKVKKLDSGENSWTVWHEGPNLSLIPPDEQQGGPCVPPDQCGYFVEPLDGSGGTTTPLVLKLPPMTIGFIAICGTVDSYQEWIKPETAYRIELNGETLDRASFTEFPTKLQKCMVLRQGFDTSQVSSSAASWLAIFSSAGLHISQVICA